MGIDCFGRNTYAGGGYLSGEALRVANEAGNSCCTCTLCLWHVSMTLGVWHPQECIRWGIYVWP